MVIHFSTETHNLCEKNQSKRDHICIFTKAIARHLSRIHVLEYIQNICASTCMYNHYTLIFEIYAFICAKLIDYSIKNE